MFDSNVYIDGSFRNVQEDGHTIGYELQTLITYYRGIPMSMIVDVTVNVDGQDAPKEDIRISTDYTDWFTLSEAETVVSYKWEYGEPLYIRVLKEGGLPAGAHQVVLTQSVRTAYIPAPLEGTRTFAVTL